MGSVLEPVATLYFFTASYFSRVLMHAIDPNSTQLIIEYEATVSGRVL